MIQIELNLKAGEIVFNGQDRKYWLDMLSKQKDGEYLLILKKKKKQRSHEQLKYLWSVVYDMISKETGMSREEIHEAMKYRFLYEMRRIVNKDKTVSALKTVKSISDLGDVDTNEMFDYIENVRQWAASFLGIVIPDPS
jgi:hypothetical protein